MNTISRYGSYGIAEDITGNKITYQILSASETQSIEEDILAFSNYGYVGDRFNLDGFTIAANGDRNLLPMELMFLVKGNPILPEVLKKQVRILYGYGPYLYQEDISDNLLKRKWFKRTDYPDFFNWLESWTKNGCTDNAETYLKKVIMNYYYTEDYFSKHLHNTGRRIGMFPIRGLEHISTTRGRLASDKLIPNVDELKDADLNWVVIGDWLNMYTQRIEAYARFRESDPFADETCVSYVRDASFGDMIYSSPTYYWGLKDWIKGSNLNPKYINSFLKNSFGAKLHCIIPHTWFITIEKKFRDLCEENSEREQRGISLIETFEEVKLTNDSGKPIAYNESMVQQCADKKVEKLMTVMSGEGKNQGKIFFSRAFRVQEGIEAWDFKEIPTKYGDYIDAIIKVDERMVKVILAGKGLDPAISNVGSEGVFNNSGAQVYYNYLVYLSSLTHAEEYCTQDINFALQVNFPKIYNQGLRVGFYRNVPQRLEDTSPANRPSNNIQ